MKIKDLKVGIIDRYIIRKFLTTYIGAIGMLVVVIIIFDMAEKLDDLMELHAPLNEILFTYYANFIPFFINQFSALITFIVTVFITSKMAYDTEIIAILSSGVSYKRLLYPYLLSSLIVSGLALALNLYIIPTANQARIDFEAKYTKKGQRGNYEDQIYRQIAPNTFFSLKGYSNKTMSAELLVIETYEDAKIAKTLTARNVTFNEETLRWTAPRYITRSYEGDKEHLNKLNNLDTMVNLSSKDIGKVGEYVKTLKIGELNSFIDEQRTKGSDMIATFEVERQVRYANPFSTFILVLIAVSLSSRKVRGGTSIHLASGITLCFAYILFMRFAEEFAKGGATTPALAVWVPNMIFAIIAIILYQKAPK